MLHQAIDILPKISIHTPTKGATCMGFISSFPIFDFNPHSHEGSDLRVQVTTSEQLLFQSTLPRRERQFKRQIQSDFCSISIHTPTKGATNVKVWEWQKSFQFQSTLPRRERLLSVDSRLVLQDYFNPHSHEGSD